MQKVVVCVSILLMAALANAATVNYSWEDGHTILGGYGNLVNPMNVSTANDPLANGGLGGTVNPSTGSSMLQLTESPHYSTPQAYIAFVKGLTDGDVVTASFFGWDSTPGVSPSLRI